MTSSRTGGIPGGRGATQLGPNLKDALALRDVAPSLPHPHPPQPPMTSQLTLPPTNRHTPPSIRGEAPEPTEKDHVPPDPEEQEEAERKDERV
jgi:hypothetical protein